MALPHTKHAFTPTERGPNSLLMLCLISLLAAGELLCRTPAECGLASGLCGDADASSPLQRGDVTTLCIGFHGAGDAASGKKALFRVGVDSYSKLSVDALRPTMGGAWADKEPYSHVWVGVNGRRTIGQKEGVRMGDQCNATAAAEGVPGPRCFGWALHDKPTVLPSNRIATGLTAVVHLEMGRVNRIQWDSGCNLCGGASAEAAARRSQVSDADLACITDGTNVSCVDGACSDCFAQLSYLCSSADEVCAPSVYVAWLGTDMHGQPLLSAGSVLSRFAAYSIRALAGEAIGEVEKLVDGVVDVGGGESS